MEPQQWETLQLHLTAGRVARDVGDLDQALEHIDAALAIDPDFAAAQVLRDSVLAPSAHSETADPAELVQAAPAASDVPPRSTDPPQFNPERYTQLEVRVRRRRIDLCLDKARQAIAEHRFPDAEAALDEVEELDSGAPGLEELVAELAAVQPASHDWERIGEDRQADEFMAIDDPIAVDDRIADITLADRMAIEDHLFGQPDVSIEDRAATDGHRGPWVALAVLLAGLAVFVALQRPQETEPLRARSIERSAPPVASTPPAATADAMTSPPVPSPPVAAQRLAPPDALPSPQAPPAAPRTAASETDIGPTPSSTAAPPTEVREPVRQLPPRIADGPIPLTVIPERAAEPSVAASPGPPPNAAPPPRPIEPAAIPAPAPATAETFAPAVDDAAMVRDTLQRYRRAYSNLDARLAHAVFPILDEGALAHAFANLRSQSLEYDACSVDVRGELARAVCRGSASYVPNIGNRTSRTERRVWTFTLEKANGDWKITSARTDR